MKHYKILLSLSLILFMFLSCSSDDGTDANQEVLPVVGVWNLTEANVSIPQDPNEDGTASSNMVDELPCLSGVLTIDASGVWSATLTRLIISPVTGDFYVVSCSGTQEFSGRFSFQNSVLDLNSTSFSRLNLSGTTLIETIGEDLPGVLGYTFEKQ